MDEVIKTAYLTILEQVNKRLSDLHWFHSFDIFFDTIVNAEKLEMIWQMPRKCVLVLDRNIFSRLINIISNGECSEGESRDIALLMVWAILMRVDIYPLFALNEGAASTGAPEIIKEEYEKFKHIYDEKYYNDWFALAFNLERKFKNVISIPDSIIKASTLKIDTASIDYLLNYAAMLHFVYVLRTNKNQNDRFKSYFEWLYNSLPVSRFTEVYVINVLLGEKHFKAPKNSESEDFEKTKHGCENQARDLSYLTPISIDRWPINEYEPILITDDWMLGEIFKLGCYDFNYFFEFENNIKKGQKQISQWVSELRKNHKPLEVPDLYNYLIGLIDNEEILLKSSFLI